MSLMTYGSNVTLDTILTGTGVLPVDRASLFILFLGDFDSNFRPSVFKLYSLDQAMWAADNHLFKSRKLWLCLQQEPPEHTIT